MEIYAWIGSGTARAVTATRPMRLIGARAKGSSVAQENLDAIRSPHGNATSEEVGILGPDPSGQPRARADARIQILV